MSGLRAHAKYASYLLRHKWFVFVECWREGLIWRGIKHDWSKLLPSEWFPYVYFFYGRDGILKQRRDKSGYYKPTDTGDAAFDFAWLLHQKRNRHHWQWWVLPLDDGGLKVLEMPDKERREMLCDWKGAGRTQNSTGVVSWYERNKQKMMLGPETRAWVENRLGMRP